MGAPTNALMATFMTDDLNAERWYNIALSRVSTVVVQRFCKPKVGGSNPSPGTIFRAIG